MTAKLISPKLLEFDANGRLAITEYAMMVEETRDIIDKYGMEAAEAPLAYCELMSAIDSPFRNLEELEKKETVIIEVHTNIGHFDEDDPLLDRCILKLKSLYATATYKLFEMGEKEIQNFTYYLEHTPMSSEDLAIRKSILIDLGRLATSLAATKRQVEEEFKDKTRGDQEAGSIR